MAQGACYLLGVGREQVLESGTSHAQFRQDILEPSANHAERGATMPELVELVPVYALNGFGQSS